MELGSNGIDHNPLFILRITAAALFLDLWVRRSIPHRNFLRISVINRQARGASCCPPAKSRDQMVGRCRKLCEIAALGGLPICSEKTPHTCSPGWHSSDFPRSSRPSALEVGVRWTIVFHYALDSSNVWLQFFVRLFTFFVGLPVYCILRLVVVAPDCLPLSSLFWFFFWFCGFDLVISVQCSRFITSYFWSVY